MSGGLDRRTVLGLLGASGAAALPVGVSAQATGPVHFDHGVASGDPVSDGAVIWTRASVDGAGDVPLRWKVRETEGGPVVREGETVARLVADRTAKVEVDGLEAGREYWYAFHAADGAQSPSGRFRTLPVGAVDQLVFAVASCQLYPGGYFNAFADMARAERLDAVIHLGDYIYEYGDAGYGADIGRRLNRLPDPPHEIVTLADYRLRHAQAKSDPDMQAAHARAAFICVWDDHEITNDGWLHGAQNHQPETEGDWAGRKAVAMQAYFEWMPIRDPSAARAKEAIYRSFEFGDLATLAMLETRLLVRSEQLEFAGDPDDANAYAAFAETLADETRQLIGNEQRDWLRNILSTSVAAGKPWQVVGNQVVMGRVAGPDLEAGMGPDQYADLIASLPSGLNDRIAAAQVGYRKGVPFNLDSWDGYPAARERLYAAFRDAGSRPIILAGDSHAGWANRLRGADGEIVALETGCTAITSPSYGSILPGIGRYIEQANPDTIYCNQDAKGYTLLTLRPGSARVDYRTVSTVTDNTFEAGIDASFEWKREDETPDWSEV